MEAFQGGTSENHLGAAVNQPGDTVIVIDREVPDQIRFNWGGTTGKNARPLQ